MRDAARDVDEVACSCDEALLQLLAEPHHDLALQDVRRRLVLGVEMCTSTKTGRERRKLEAEPARPGRARRDARGIRQSGRPLDGLRRPDKDTTLTHLDHLLYSSWEYEYPPLGSICQVQKLTTTSYLILGLLALRRWSTYELAQQMQRSIQYYWPRAESKIYEEPKKLVEHGLATATREYAGRRPRTVYAITNKGRRALRRWLAEPGTGRVVEFEGLVKGLFAERGGKEKLPAPLASTRDEAEENRLHHAELASDLAETGGPFPDR